MCDFCFVLFATLELGHSQRKLQQSLQCQKSFFKIFTSEFIDWSANLKVLWNAKGGEVARARNEIWRFVWTSVEAAYWVKTQKNGDVDQLHQSTHDENLIFNVLKAFTQTFQTHNGSKLEKSYKIIKLLLLLLLLFFFFSCERTKRFTFSWPKNHFYRLKKTRRNWAKKKLKSWTKGKK